MRVEILREQGRGGRRCAILTQAHDLAAHHIRQDSPEALALPALHLIEADLPRSPLPAGAIPLGQEGRLGAPGFAPADAVPHSGVAGRHRLAIQADLLAQAARDPGLRGGKVDPLRAHPAVATDHASLPVDQRDRMPCPGQIVPRPLARGAHAAGAASTAVAHIAPYPAPLQLQPQATLHPVVLPFDAHHSEARQAQDPGTIPLRSHVSSLLGCTSRENNTGWSGASGIAFFRPGRRAGRPPQLQPEQAAGYHLRSLYSNRRRAEKGDLFPGTGNWHRYSFVVVPLGQVAVTQNIIMLWDTPGTGVLLSVIDPSNATVPIQAVSFGHDRMVSLELGLAAGTYEIWIAGTTAPTHYHLNVSYGSDELLSQQPNVLRFSASRQADDLRVEALLAPYVQRLEQAASQ